AAADEAASGRTVGMNWVGGGTVEAFVDDSTTEAPTGPTEYSPDAFTWPTHQVGGTQNIGVAGAWRALDFADRLSPGSVPLAVLDMGFAPDRDWASDWVAIGNVPAVDPIGTRNALGCSEFGDCPWHGTDVVSSAMALPDNGYGAAGPGGPVAEPIAVYTLYDFFTSITALAEARLLGARIANMSYSAPVPLGLGFSVAPFATATLRFHRAGMLLFAAAGNNGDDVDSEVCLFGFCSETTWHTPCENPGVICVGGLAWDSKDRHSSSNYGDENVDIYGPYELFAGPNPDHAENAARMIRGTSFASPFVAGVAALVWAADPGLGADEVEALLMETAHESPDEDVARYVDAYGAVTTALGDVPPAVEILRPDDGASLQTGLSVTLWARARPFDDGIDCCAVEWESDVDGPLGTGESIRYAFPSPGARTLNVTATDGNGLESTETVVVEVVNTPPSPRITRPLDGGEVHHSVQSVLRGYADDPNESGGRVPCESIRWASSDPADTMDPSGCAVTATFADAGPRTVTMHATDSHGAAVITEAEVTAVDPPENLPPSVTVTSPDNGAVVPHDTLFTLDGTATDPEGELDLERAWYALWPYDEATGESDNETLIGLGGSVEWRPTDTMSFTCGEHQSATVRVELRVTDPGGAVGHDFVVIEPTQIC
ncbi:MAG: S8 family serine peptidase, partial [Gemmatimonadota bacterium]